MRIKFSDYILEQSISDAVVSDIALEQAKAEVEVTLAITEAYIKQMEMQMYTEMEGEVTATATEKPIEGTAEQSVNDQNAAKKLSQLKYKNKHMTVGDKILWYNTVFIGRVWAWFVKVFTNMSAYFNKKHINQFLLNMKGMSDEDKANFKVRIDSVILRANNANDLNANIGMLKSALTVFMNEFGNAFELVCKKFNVDPTRFKEIATWIITRIKDEIKIPSLNLPEPVFASYAISVMFIWVTKFVSEGNKLLSDTMKNFLNKNYGVDDSQNHEDLAEVKKRLRRLQRLPGIIGTAGMKIVNKIGRKRGYFDAGKPEEYEDLDYQQTIDLIKRLMAMTDNTEVKNVRNAMTKSKFIDKTSEAISGDNVDDLTRSIAKIMFNAYKQFYKVTLTVMSNGTNCIGNIVKAIETTINNSRQQSNSETEGSSDETTESTETVEGGSSDGETTV